MSKVERTEVWAVEVPIKVPRRHSDGVTASARRTILRLTTDDGVTGVGEVSVRVPSEYVRSVLAAMVGTSVFDTTRVRLHVQAGKFPSQYRSIMFAGLEMAMLDIQGKMCGQPVCHLLGGAMRDRVQMIAYAFRSGPEDCDSVPLYESIVKLVSEYGFQTIKLKAGAATPEDDLDVVSRLRERWPKSPMRIDPNGAWSVATTLRLSRVIGDLGLEWLEDPVLTVEAMRTVRERTATPLATNMCITSFSDLPAAISDRPVDVVLLDLWYLGGLRSAMQFQRALDSAKIDVGIHSGGGSSELGVGQAAALHLAAALPQLNFAADSMYHHLADDVIAGDMLEITAGTMAVPSGPGLGVELDDEKIDRYSMPFDGAPTDRSFDSAPHVYPSY